jgi:hypothetical protein
VEPEFIGLDVVLVLHTKSLQRFGGTDGVRDIGLVESALGAAQNVYFYANGDLFDIAAAYAFHIAQAQAFLDGLCFSFSKRVFEKSRQRKNLQRHDRHRRKTDDEGRTRAIAENSI